MNGLHLTADLSACTCAATLLTDRDTLAALCRQHTLAVGLQIVAEQWHRFPDAPAGPGGITGALLLAESHLAIHTWPELAAVTLDVYVCNFGQDNVERAEALLAALLACFAAQEARINRLWRGAGYPPATCPALSG